MLKILPLIVFSFIYLNAKNIPMVQNIKIYVPIKQWVVIELPFEIKGKNFTPFVYYVKNKKNKNNFKISDLELPNISNKKQKTNKNKFLVKKKLKNSLSPIKATFGRNIVQLYIKKEGKTELLLYGYKKYPMMLTIVATKDKEISNKYIKFYDSQQVFNMQDEFKNLKHENICVKIIQKMYNNQIPGGFKLISPYNEYIEDNLKLVLIKEVVGKFYAGLEYKITNLSPNNRLLSEEMFAGSQIYAVSIENRNLKPNETTKLFLVINSSK